MISRRYWGAITQCLPLEWKGITLTPVRVRDKDALMENCVVLTIMQQTLPVEFVSMSYLRVLYQMDNSTESGSLGKLRKTLFLCSGIGADDINFCFRGEALFMDMGGVMVSEHEFINLRAIIAEQNLIKLPREQHNMELVDARRDMEASEKDTVTGGFENELYFVANNSHLTLEQCYGMTIREFYKRLQSMTNQINNEQASAVGAGMSHWKNGNPYPSPVYPPKESYNHLVTEDEMAQRKKGMGAGTPEII